MDYIQFVLFKFFKLIVNVLPKSLIQYILVYLSKFLYLIDKKHKKIAMANLDLAFGNSKSFNEKIQIVKASYLNIVFNLYEFIINYKLSLDELEKKVKVLNEHIIKQAINDNRKIILVTAHYGNWELVNTFNSLKYKPMTVVGRPMNNKYLNKDLRSSRNQNNSQMLDKDSAAKGLVKALKEDRMVALVVDQNTASNMGILIDFFGKKARQTEAPAKLAMKFNALIIPVFVIQNGFSSYNMKFCDPIDVSNIENPSVEELTQMQADIIEEQIKAKPEDWFWQHRRWKNQYPEIYE